MSRSAGKRFPGVADTQHHHAVRAVGVRAGDVLQRGTHAAVGRPAVAYPRAGILRAVTQAHRVGRQRRNPYRSVWSGRRTRRTQNGNAGSRGEPGIRSRPRGAKPPGERLQPGAQRSVLCGKRCTSCGQPTATAILPAQYRAWSSPGVSMTAKPPRCSLDSANGPSVKTGVPLPGSTAHTAVHASSPPSLKTKTPAAVISSITARPRSPVTQFLRGEVGHPFVVEGDQVQRHLMLLCSRAAPAAAAHHLDGRARADQAPRQELPRPTCSEWAIPHTTEPVTRDALMCDEERTPPAVSARRTGARARRPQRGQTDSEPR